MKSCKNSGLCGWRSHGRSHGWFRFRIQEITGSFPKTTWYPLLQGMDWNMRKYVLNFTQIHETNEDHRPRICVLESKKAKNMQKITKAQEKSINFIEFPSWTPTFSSEETSHFHRFDSYPARRNPCMGSSNVGGVPFFGVPEHFPDFIISWIVFTCIMHANWTVLCRVYSICTYVHNLWKLHLVPCIVKVNNPSII